MNSGKVKSLRFIEIKTKMFVNQRTFLELSYTKGL